MGMIRKWATPLTIGSFLVMAVTGILMFFHLDSGLNKVAHEWLGWAMIAGVAAHLAVNFRAFQLYFTRPLANTIMAGFALVLCLTFLPLGGSSGGGTVARVMQAMSSAPIEQVIALSGEDPVIGIGRLAAQGIVAEPGQSLAELSGGDRGREGEILNAIFAH